MTSLDLPELPCELPVFACGVGIELSPSPKQVRRNEVSSTYLDPPLVPEIMGEWGVEDGNNEWDLLA